MGIKVKAMERNIAFDKSKNPHYAYVMQPELYGQLAEDKVIAQASLNSGMPKPAVKAAINAYGEVVKTWATEGHSIPIPGLGTMRFGVRSNSVDDVTKVSSALITSRRVIFTPNTDIKKELASTPVTITCYDRNGKIVQTVTSEDKDKGEDTDDNNKKNPSSDSDSKDTDKKENTDQKEDAGGGSGSASGDAGGTTTNPGDNDNQEY